MYRLQADNEFHLSTDMSFWLRSGQENLQKNLAYRNNENRAKNVIIFIGDGMGVSTIDLSWVYF